MVVCQRLEREPRCGSFEGAAMHESDDCIVGEAATQIIEVYRQRCYCDIKVESGCIRIAWRLGTRPISSIWLLQT